MEFEWYIYLLVVGAGFLAGFINTLAGSGSLVTLPLLVFMGLPPTVANGTNRVGILFQSIIGFGTIYRNSDYRYRESWGLVISSLIGAVLGAQIAADLNEEMMNLAIGILMVVMLLVILVKPKRWLHPPERSRFSRNHPAMLILFFLIGIYGGFIQAGVGIFMLAGLVLGARYNLIHANAIKLLIVLIYALPTLIVFTLNDQVHWEFGLLLSVGQVAGAWIAAKFATSHPRADVWIRRLLILIVVVSIVKFFRIDHWVAGLISGLF